MQERQWVRRSSHRQQTLEYLHAMFVAGKSIIIPCIVSLKIIRFSICESVPACWLNRLNYMYIILFIRIPTTTLLLKPLPFPIMVTTIHNYYVVSIYDCYIVESSHSVPSHVFQQSRILQSDRKQIDTGNHTHLTLIFFD